MSIKGKLKEFIYRIRGEISTERLIELGLVVGENFNREEQCIIDQSHCWLIKIGNNVTLAPRVHILAHDASMHHEIGYTKIAPVHIGNNVFVGAGTIILPGVTIGDNVVIGAGSVVVTDIESNSVAVGQPAKKIKTYKEYIAYCTETIKNAPTYGEDYTLRSAELTNVKKQEMYNILMEQKVGFVK